MCDCCQAAIKTAYRELRSRGLDDEWAFEAAVEVYRFHHPATDMARACKAVSETLPISL